ncbi:hypothetical protein POM88_028688 [Heracleum sosnowskyi]|uniref:Helitron helicase-like domain-containing protein n=1 Tax=Heracleum sosnowskyi TaxID=360622 RepID=A0AAD8ME90_9APIA|nr:hypothetical protein POM88_028688 [Heracleum sosnowskyi]
MKGPNNNNERNETGEKVDDYIEKRLKQYLERNNKQREIYENQFVAEKSLSEIIAGKRRIKRNAQMREEYKERKMRNDVPLHLETEETVGKEIHNQLMVRSAYEIDEVEDELSHNQLEKSMEPKNNLTDVPSNPDMTNASYVEETADNSHGTICTNYASGSGVEAESIEKREERNRKRRQRYHGNQESTEQREEQRKRRRLTYQNGIQVETIQQRKERNEKRRRIYQNGNAAPSLEYDASKLIVRPSLKFIGLPPLSKRMRNKINSIKEKFASSDTILDIGCADKICCDCGALMWRFEQTGKQQRLNSNKFSLCCGNGKVRLPLLRETPPELKALLERTNKKGVVFHKCSRLYNSAFAFTSVGANLDKDINNGGGPYVYRVHGVVYHQIGSLRPEDSDKAVFSQIYMYDNQQQLEERLNFPKNDDKLDLEITESLSTMLHRENALVDIYRQVRDRFDELEITPARSPAERPDVLARVFKIKLDLLLEDLTDKHILGKVIGVAYTIETETTIDANGYPVYRRRDNKRTIQLKEVEVDNRFVVPYNKGLIKKQNMRGWSFGLRSPNSR